MIIKVLEKIEGCFPVTFKIGYWYDLCTAEDVTLEAPQANKLHKKITNNIIYGDCKI